MNTACRSAGSHGRDQMCRLQVDAIPLGSLAGLQSGRVLKHLARRHVSSGEGEALVDMSPGM